MAFTEVPFGPIISERNLFGLFGASNRVSEWVGRNELVKLARVGEILTVKERRNGKREGGKNFNSHRVDWYVYFCKVVAAQQASVPLLVQLP